MESQTSSTPSTAFRQAKVVDAAPQDKLEALINGRAPEAVSAAELDQAITASFTARDGLRASWAYRSLLARNLVLQFVEEAATNATEVTA